MLKSEGQSGTGVNTQASKTRPAHDKRFKQQIEFILEADKLEKIARMTTLLDVSRQENSAEHAWPIALLNSNNR
jgi:hypothetical protein